MSYTVLARKYRPKSFYELVGQEHVKSALINSLKTGRVHHAYLFAGTRGVGKTTIARILSKCLNCESVETMTAEPCETCATCTEINEGRFVDLLEIDAASRTKVEDTRDMLDNVQYAPTRGRYKVYLIDEVHMLSTHSFNALLKTLEEPPEHVKFLLATTDPQKLPITVLSRCLQFNLRKMAPAQIVEHLDATLQAENIPFEKEGLWHLARAADGSMRDAMSLTDQAIVFSGEKLTEATVREMLGVVESRQVTPLIDALIADDGSALLKHAKAIAENAPDYGLLSQELLRIIHQVAIFQKLPDAIDNTDQLHFDKLKHYAQNIPAPALQLYYQILLQGGQDIQRAVDAQIAFEMVLLRLLAFKPVSIKKEIQQVQQAEQANQQETSHVSEVTIKKPEANLLLPQNRLETVNSPKPLPTLKENSPENNTETIQPNSPPEQETVTQPATTSLVSENKTNHLQSLESEARFLQDSQASMEEYPAAPRDEQKNITTYLTGSGTFLAENWVLFIQELALPQSAVTMLDCCAVKTVDQQSLTLDMPSIHDVWHSQENINTVENSLRQFTDNPNFTLQINLIEHEPQPLNTPMALSIAKEQARQQSAEDAIVNDPDIQYFIKELGGKIISHSVKPMSPSDVLYND